MDSGVVIYNYMDTFFCCVVPKDKYCEEMVTEHMLCYLCAGEMELISPTRKYRLKKGDAFFVRRNHMLRKIKKPSKDGEPFKGLFLQLKHPFLKKMMSEHKIAIPTTDKKSVSNAPYVLLDKHPFLNGLFLSLEGYFDARQYPSRDLMEAKLKEAVFTLLQIQPDLGTRLFDFIEPWKIDLRQFMEQNFHRDMTIEDFAHFTGRSLTSFKNEFSSVFGGITPSRWITKRRLQEAKRMMTESGRKASDVYLEVGFKSLSHFSTAFKREFGMSPSEL